MTTPHPDTQDDDNKLAYTVPAFCKAIGISIRTFYVLQERNEGPPLTRIGRRVLIRRESGEQWLRDRELAA
jgi:predicted DNA-binding transcriptional regulator AlpA